LHATTHGEKAAAGRARDRIRERLKRWEQEDPPAEFRFSLTDMWERKVFVALLRRYGLRPYRYSGQRYTTVMTRVSKRFVDETLWPELQEISDTLHNYLSDVTDRVVQQVIHQDNSEAEVVEKPKQLSAVVNPSDKAAVPGPALDSDKQAGISAQPDTSSNSRNKKKRRRKKQRKG
jgi:hypothetical protein